MSSSTSRRSAATWRDSLAIDLRSARPEDKEAILAISAQVWEGEDYIPHVLDGWLTEGGFVVAELDGRVAGFAKMTLLSPGEVWLEGLRVDPAQRGKGVATALAQSQLAAARDLRPCSIRFATAEVNRESIHIATKQGFREVARFTYMDGAVRDEPAPSGIVSVRDEGKAWGFISSSSAYREACGLLGLGWRFPALSPERLGELVRAGEVYSYGDEIRGLLIQVPDPYAPSLYSSLAFLDGDDAALDALVRFAHARAREGGQARLSAMAPGERIVEILSRRGLRFYPEFRYVLLFEFPLP